MGLTHGQRKDLITKPNILLVISCFWQDKLTKRKIRIQELVLPRLTVELCFQNMQKVFMGKALLIRIVMCFNFGRSSISMIFGSLNSQHQIKENFLITVPHRSFGGKKERGSFTTLSNKKKRLAIHLANGKQVLIFGEALELLYRA